MSICIYRHRKLYVVMPRTGWKKPELFNGMQFNFAPIAGNTCRVTLLLPADPTAELACFRMEVMTSSINNKHATSLRWTASKNGDLEASGIGYHGRTQYRQVERQGRLANLAWSMKHQQHKLYEMMEYYCSRSIIELLMHETEVDAERYDIIQVYFDEKDQQFHMNVMPIRDLKTAREQSITDRSESPQEWLRLFELA